MTEAEWLSLSESEPAVVFRRVVGKGRLRLLRLCAAACCRRVVHLVPYEECLRAIELTELLTDRKATRDQLRALRWDLSHLVSESVLSEAAHFALVSANVLAGGDETRVLQQAVNAAACASLPGETYTDAYQILDCPAHAMEKAAQVVIIRDVFRQYFLPVAFNPTWRTATVSGLARPAYEERHLPSGRLDPARLSVLADALEDAGCAEEALLSHLHSPGPHVRGCWALDLILGKQ